MTNYYTEGSVDIPTADNSQKMLVLKLVEAINFFIEYPGNVPYGEAVEFTEEELDRLEEATECGPDIAKAVANIFGYDLMHHGLGTWTDKTHNSVTLYHDEHFDPDYVAVVVQEVLNLLDTDETVSFSWINTDSRSIPFEREGGATVISRDSEIWMTTDFWKHVIGNSLVELGLAKRETSSMIPTDPTWCPKCKAINPEIDYGDTEVYLSGTLLSTMLTCKDCDTSWKNVYTIANKLVMEASDA